jgi:FMN phosphatase YigB (HAD superfamily)
MTNDANGQIKYMPGAHAYLQELRDKGYHVGLLVNIPEAWGKTQEEKLKTTKSVLASEWVDSIPLDWDQFDLGVAFPPTDAERKPAPYLFNQAVQRAHEADCDAVYETTLPEEIPAANQAGMVGIYLGTGDYDGSFYYPEARLRARDYSILHSLED